MKKVSIISLIAGVTVSCSLQRCKEGRRVSVYMPDMAYSRAYETYASTANTRFSMGIHYDKYAVYQEQLKRGELLPFHHCQKMQRRFC